MSRRHNMKKEKYVINKSQKSKAYFGLIIMLCNEPNIDKEVGEYFLFINSLYENFTRNFFIKHPLF